MENRNLPRHLRRQFPSAEANFEGWVHILKTSVTHLLIPIHQKKKIALEIATKIASVLQNGWKCYFRGSKFQNLHGETPSYPLHW
jgi:hypothetical protein